MCSDSCSFDTECRGNQNSVQVCIVRVRVTRVRIVPQKVVAVHIGELGSVLLNYCGRCARADELGSVLLNYCGRCARADELVFFE
jgi:hypothetical protein